MSTYKLQPGPPLTDTVMDFSPFGGIAPGRASLLA